ncbi:hypothetical protein DIPPA_25415 [Diplonema papillatum]|nr:hypothetical protein DIPPA_25415 [Diplonema papillatum]
MSPPDCSSIYVHTFSDDNMPCAKGDVMMSAHIISACEDVVCPKLGTGVLSTAGYDGASGNVYSKSGSTCTYQEALATPTQYICGPAPPHTAFMEAFKEDFLPDGDRAVDVCVLGNSRPERDVVVVATTSGLTALAVRDSGKFEKVGSLKTAYTAVQTALGKPTVVYGLTTSAVDVLTFETASQPMTLGSVSIPSVQCATLVQLMTGRYHYLYAGCSTSGVFAIDVEFNKSPTLVIGKNSKALFVPGEGVEVKGMFIDASRSMLLVATYSTVRSGVSMYNISDPAVAVAVTATDTDFTAYEMTMVGTVVYIAADEYLEMYDTASLTFEKLGYCCVNGPELHIVGVDYFDGLIYASDWTGKLVVMNVTDPTASSYVGHRELPPAASGNSNGKEGIVVLPLADSIVRVLQAADNGGLVVFSDTEPFPTPVPQTALPPPPSPPFDCSTVTVHDKVEGENECPPGKAGESMYIVDKCNTAICAQMVTGDLASFDGDVYFTKKSDGTCAWNILGTATKTICGIPPPHTAFGEVHRGDVLPAKAIARDVAIQGSDSNDVLVASSAGLTVLHALHSTDFRLAVHIDGDYYSVLPASNNPDIAFALRSTQLDVISLSPLDSSKVVGTVALPSKACSSMVQLRIWTGLHVLYVSCHADGVFLVDVADNAKPELLNNKTAVFTTSSGETKGMVVDNTRGYLFAGTWGETPSLHMYGVGFPNKPREAAVATVDYDAHELAISGNILYVAASEKVVIFDTTDEKLTVVGHCCNEETATMQAVGIFYYDNMVYVSDHGVDQGKLVVINVEDETAPYYMGHKDLPYTGEFPFGREGIVVGSLGDGIVRVFQAGDVAGLFVFSDEEPVATPSPPTPMPPPPMLPPNCHTLYVHDSSTDGEMCEKGDVLMSNHVINACRDDVCGLLTSGTGAGYDIDNRIFNKQGSTCDYGSTTSSSITKWICGPSPPYTTYMQRFDDGFLQAWSRAVDVAVLKPNDDAVFVATTKDLTVLQLDAGSFKRVGYWPTSYIAVIAAEGHENILFALASSSLDIISVESLTSPSRVATVTISSFACANLEQLRTSTKHVVFCSCANSGIFAVDVSTIASPKLLNSNKAIVLPSSGTSKGMAIDEPRQILFAVTTGSAAGVHMYNISIVSAPKELDMTATDNSAYELDIDGTIIYIAASSRLEIYETAAGTFEQLSWCCHYGPGMFLVGIQHFNGLVYASDYSARLVVMNVTDPEAPFYMGHKEMPAGSGGNSNGKEGIVVVQMSDNIVRVFEAADNGGLVVFSDVEPRPTSAPNTPLPRPPSLPVDCSAVFIVEGDECPAGSVLLNEHMLNQCTADFCSTLETSDYVKYDQLSYYWYRKSGSGCTSLFYDYYGVATHAACGPPPPLTAYLEQHQNDILVNYAQCRDVAVLGSDSNDIVAATSGGVTILHAYHSVGFKKVGHVNGNYFAVTASQSDPDLLYALKNNAFDVISLTPPENPENMGTVSIPSTACQRMVQFKTQREHIMYVACHSQGIFAVDLLQNSKPVLMNNGSAVMHTLSGETKGITADVTRQLLFASTWGDAHAVHMYDITDRISPVSLDDATTLYNAYEFTLQGTILYVAADRDLEIYETATLKFVAIGACCESGPDFMMVGIAYYDGFVYGSGFNQKLVVMNVTDPYNPFYVGYRQLPQKNYMWPNGKEGIIVAALEDGVPRVFQAAGSGGVMVFSDIEPVATPSPPTPMPPPPMLPPDCTLLYVHEYATNTLQCNEGHVLMSTHLIEVCAEICDDMQEGWQAGFDGNTGKLYTKTATGCEFVESTAIPDRYICGVPPPHTAYMTVYDDGFLPDYSRAVDVVALGESKDEVLVATTTALTVLQMQGNGYLKTFGSLDGAYVSLLPAGGQPNVLYGLKSHQLDIISVIDVSSPVVVGRVPIPSYLCANLEQFTTQDDHVVYASCNKDGIYAINVDSNTAPKLLNGGSPIVKLESGESKGMLVDAPRAYLFVASAGGDSAFHLYNISDPSVAYHLAKTSTGDSAYEMAMHGTVLYVVAASKLDIFETGNGLLTQISFCCSFAPDMHLVGIQYYNGMIYASDWMGKLVVMNVQDNTAPAYIGHRDLPPASGGNSNGKEGLFVTTMGDGIVRVFQAADNGGLVMFSDVQPIPTPAPPTPMPAAPVPPFNCDNIVVNTYVEGASSCTDGTVLENSHAINKCITEICSRMSDSDVASFDGPDGMYFVRTGTSCSVKSSSSAASKVLCGVAPPHTAYMVSHKSGTLMSGSYAREVCVLGSHSNDVAVATSKGLSILNSYASVGLKTVGTLSGNYYSVLAAEDDADLLFALTPSSLQIVSLTPPSSPQVLGTAVLGSWSCHGLAQLRRGTTVHVVYASCHAQGVYAVDVRVNDNPVVMNDGAAVLKPASGEPKGFAVDETHTLLFVATWGNTPAVHMYDVSVPDTPTEVASAETSGSAFEVVSIGTYVYVAAQRTLDVFDSANQAMVKLGWCCGEGSAPSMFMVGLTVYDNVAYASDFNGKLIAFNVTVPSEPYYIGHRDLPQGNGKEGITAAALNDGVVRVFQASDSGGLVVFSDEEPGPTPAPLTPMPPPPVIPPDCSAMYVFTRTADTAAEVTCNKGDVLMSEHLALNCMDDMCVDIEEGWMVAIDESEQAMTKESGVCKIVDYSELPERYACSPAPAYTTYISVFDDGVLPTSSQTYDVAAVGADTCHVLVATSGELSMLRLKDNGNYERIGGVENTGYMAVVPAEGSADKAFALRSNGLDVVDITDFSNPTVSSSVSLSSYRCSRLREYKTSTFDVVYASCHDQGVFAIDVRNEPTLLNNGVGLKPLTGEAKGLYVDVARNLLFVVTWGSDPHVHMYDLSSPGPGAPAELSSMKTDRSSYEIAMSGTYLFLAAEPELEVMNSDGGQLTRISSCCSHAPSMHLVGLTYFNGMVYASDYMGKLVVMNVTEPTAPYYVGHRDLPSGFNGKEGIIVATCESTPRVFQAGAGGGLAVFGDIEPMSTPVPPTLAPPPPPMPPSCDDIEVYEGDNATGVCPEGKVIMTKHVVNWCMTEVCEKMVDGTSVALDGEDSMILRKVGTTCEIVSGTADSGAACGPPAPLTKFVSSYREDLLPDGSSATDVAVLGTDDRNIVVVGSGGLTIIRTTEDGKFQRAAQVSGGDYVAVLAADHNPDIVYALTKDSLHIYSVMPASSAGLIGEVSIDSSSCKSLSQLRWSSNTHIAYLNCGESGVFAVDVLDSKAPKVLAEGKPVIDAPVPGMITDVFVDEKRSTLFATMKTADQASVAMYSLTNPTKPELLDSILSDHTSFDAEVVGTLVYVAAGDKLEVYETASGKFQLLSACCDEGPVMNLVSIKHMGGLIYATDASGKLVVLNVTDPRAPYYAGHRDMPDGVQVDGNNRLTIAALADGEVRVFQAAGDSGLVVFSNVESAGNAPPMTPSPNVQPTTPAPVSCEAYTLVDYNDGTSSGDSESSGSGLNGAPRDSSSSDTPMPFCPDGMTMPPLEEVQVCWDAICSQLDAGASAGFGDGSSTIVANKKNDCGLGGGGVVATKAICRAKESNGTPAPPNSAANNEESGDNTGLLVAAIIGPIFVMLLAAGALAAVYVYMKKMINKSVDEELQDFDYVRTQEFDGPEEQLTEAEILQATASNNSNYDKL